jgi:hypothetical protein
MDIGFERSGVEVGWTNEFNSDIAEMDEPGITALRW